MHLLIVRGLKLAYIFLSSLFNQFLPCPWPFAFLNDGVGWWNCLEWSEVFTLANLTVFLYNSDVLQLVVCVTDLLTETRPFQSE